jgi:hypothetical protein
MEQILLLAIPERATSMMWCSSTPFSTRRDKLAQLTGKYTQNRGFCRFSALANRKKLSAPRDQNEQTSACHRTRKA